MPTKKGGPHFVYKPSKELQRLSFEYRRFQIVSGIALPNLLNIAMLATTRQFNMRKASDAPLFTFYVYRAESDDNVPWIELNSIPEMHHGIEIPAMSGKLKRVLA